MTDTHMQWCEPYLCEHSPDGAHVSPAITDEDNQVMLFVAAYPDECPHLVVTVADTEMVAVPQHLLHGFLLSVAKLVGGINQSPETAVAFEEALVSAYRGGELAVMKRVEARCRV